MASHMKYCVNFIMSRKFSKKNSCWDEQDHEPPNLSTAASCEFHVVPHTTAQTSGGHLASGTRHSQRSRMDNTALRSPMQTATNPCTPMALSLPLGMKHHEEHRSVTCKRCTTTLSQCHHAPCLTTRQNTGSTCAATVHVLRVERVVI